MRITIKTITALTSFAGLLIGNTALAVINGGFETASGAFTTGALGWNDTSGLPANTTGSASRSLVDPFAGLAELTLTYTVNTAGGGPAVSAQSAIFGGMSPGAVTLSFEAKRVVAGFENNQVQVQWFDAGNVFLGATGFSSFNGTLTPAYSLQTKNYVAPANTAGALIQFLQAGSANVGDTATLRIDDVTLIPEPTTLALVGLGLLGLLGLRRHKA